MLLTNIRKSLYFPISFIFLAFCLCACAGQQHKEVNSVLDDPAFIKDFNSLSIYAVAPASGNTQNFIEKIAQLRTVISFCLPDNSILIDANPYHSNSDSERARFLSEALNNTHTQIIWALTGGYG